MSKVINKEIIGMFNNAETIGELREAYIKAFMRYKTGALMEQANTLYIEKFDAVKGICRAKSGKLYKRDTEETVSWFLNAVNVLKGCEDIDFYREYDWIWIKGDTKPIKEALKGCGARYSGKRKQWYFQV